MKVSLGPKTYASPNPVWVLGSYNPDGKPNIMTAAYCTPIHISPPLLIIALNPNSQTFKNIEERKAFTVNMPGAEHWRETDYIGMVSGKDHDKFKETNLTPVKAENVDAPYVDEFPSNLECKLHDIIKIAGRVKVIGEIVDVKVDEDKLTDGKPDLLKLQSLVYCSGQGTYNTPGELLGKAYANPKPPGKAD